MLNAVIRFALRYRLLVVVASLVLLFYGSYLATLMPIDVFPDLDHHRVPGTGSRGGGSARHPAHRSRPARRQWRGGGAQPIHGGTERDLRRVQLGRRGSRRTADRAGAADDGRRHPPRGHPPADDAHGLNHGADRDRRHVPPAGPTRRRSRRHPRDTLPRRGGRRRRRTSGAGVEGRRPPSPRHVGAGSGAEHPVAHARRRPRCRRPGGNPAGSHAHGRRP